jgi:hypothetical protein
MIDDLLHIRAAVKSGILVVTFRKVGGNQHENDKKKRF